MFDVESHAPEVVRRQYAIRRAGWVQRGIKNPESVGEHKDALVVLFDELLSQMPNYTEFMASDTRSMLLVHDWPKTEPDVGDEIELASDPASKRLTRHVRQELAMERICSKINPPYGSRIFHIWERFAKSADDVAKFARAIDKFQPIELAAFYERTGKGPKGLFREFVENSPKVEYPILQERLRRCEVGVLV